MHIVWPDKSTEVPHDDPRFLIAYMPLEFAGMPRKGQEEKARELFETYGDRPRKYRNGLGLAIPSDEQIEILRRSVRYLLAIEQVRRKAKQLNLTNEQKGQLTEGGSTEEIRPRLEDWSIELLPKSPIGQAVSYARGQWESLNQYLHDGDLAIDNNLSERILRTVAIGRKNWQFAGSDAGAERAAVTTVWLLLVSCATSTLLHTSAMFLIVSAPIRPAELRN